ncbi:uncharacterized protein LOC105445713 [Strongylocentrotus purpuratus]|uniref:Tyrosine-protein kinase ephrin type A/B receptor-like domain-containing protein n=1 Tax=Strongylocentrotus purpuratus TaxID=7668 RepID=A0A7M7SVF5_STRPU|nr:uncharacterized protein LOC105445713 [Strongylocentrotus purpuratus]
MRTARGVKPPWTSGAALPGKLRWNLNGCWKLILTLILCNVLIIDSVSGACDCETDCASSCTAGQYWDSNATACFECPPGYYCTGGGDPRLPCSGGTYNSLASQTSESACMVSG